MKKLTQIIGILAGIVIIIFLIIFFRNYYLIRTGQLIEWEGKWYTMDEIREKYGPQVYEVESKNTPEDVYTQFRQALLDDDLETALSLIREESRDKYQEAFQEFKSVNNNLKKLGDKYPEQINKDHEYGNFASFSFVYINNNNEKKSSSIEFIKNEEGYWEIDQI